MYDNNFFTEKVKNKYLCTNFEKQLSYFNKKTRIQLS